MKRPAERVLQATLRDLEVEVELERRLIPRITFEEGYIHGRGESTGRIWLRPRDLSPSPPPSPPPSRRVPSLWLDLISRIYKLWIELRSVWYSILFR
jgi:hypothetical protein